MLITIVKNRNHLNEDYIKSRFGFLISGYKSNLYYWEFVIIYRKISIVFLSVFLSTVGTTVQALAAFLVLVISFYLQSTYNPFTVGKLNRLELMSILTAATTIYCGLLFLTDNMSNEMNILLFVLILISNAVFGISWIHGISEAYAILLSDKNPKIFKWLCFCFLKRRRFRDFAAS